jgi:hypothetical protein
MVHSYVMIAQEAVGFLAELSAGDKLQVLLSYLSILFSYAVVESCLGALFIRSTCLMNLMSAFCILRCALNFKSPGIPAARNTHEFSL